MMDLGLGVFLGSVFFGTVLLYLKTQDRWNWRRIWKRIALGVFAVVALASIGTGAIVGYLSWEARPRVVTSFEGVSLGEKFSDVQFRHGPFMQPKSKDNANRSSDGDGLYINDAKGLFLPVRNGVVVGIQYFCKNTTDYTSANGIRCEETGEEILNRFGKSVRVQCPTNKDDHSEFRRAYDVPEFGVRYLMQRNRVEGFYVTDQLRFAAEGGIWTACN